MEKLESMLASIGSNIKKKQLKNTQENSILNTTKIDIELDKNSVTKSNSLARAYYRFNLVEKRIMESLISQINPLDSDEMKLKKLELKSKDYAELFDVSSNHAYVHLKESVQNLVKKVFSVEVPGKRIEFTLMSYAEYIENEGRIVCSFNPYIIPHLIGIRRNFTKYLLNTAASFKSSYTWRFYELLMSWSQDPKETKGLIKGWFNIKIDELRNILGVPESYQWGHIKIQVLDVIKKELLESLNIHIQIDLKKTGKKISTLKFTFNQKDAQ